MKTIKEIQSYIDELIKEASQKPEDYAKFKRRKRSYQQQLSPCAS